MKHIVALSGGKDSTALSLALIEKEPREYTFVCTPTGNEPDEWFAHMRSLREKLGPITPIMYPGGLNALINKYNALPNWRMRWCTRELKIEPFAAYLMKNSPAVFYVGLRADEEKREGGDYKEVPNVQMRFPLREWGWGLEEVLAYLQSKNQKILKRTDCKLCFFQRIIEWYELWRDNPQGYAEGELLEEQTGHTFRSPGRDTQPTSLRDLRSKFESGWVPRDTRETLKTLQCRVCRL